MPSRILRDASVLLALWALTPGAVRAQKGPALPDLLKLAGDYLMQYSQKLGAVCAEEEYLQYETSAGRMGQPKRVITDFVWLGFAGGSVEGFRDVVGIDRVPVRPRDDRLLALFTTPTAASLSQARQMTADAIRQYVDGNMHVLDQPTLALEYLRPANQGRSTFKIESVKSMNGAQVAVVKFNEKSEDRLIPSPENAAAVGRFWIDTASGTVRQTELGLGGRSSNIHVTVKYAADGGTSLWLPVDMFQQISVSGGISSASNNMGAGGGYTGQMSLEGHASYAKFRQVAVDMAKLR